MNIWYLSAHDQPRGQSSRTYDYSRELVRRGHSVTMFTNSFEHRTHEELLGPGEGWRIDWVDHIRVAWLKTVPYKGNGLDRGLNMLSNVARAIQVSRMLHDEPDVVIGPSVPLGTAWAAWYLARRHGAAFVFEVRDVWPQALVDNGALSAASPVYFGFRAMERGLYRRADRISATLPFLRPHVAECGGAPDRVEWLPQGVNLELFADVKPYAGGSQRPLVAMYVGGFGVAHDVISIVRAAHILQQRQNAAFHFVLVGGGVKREECRREADRLRLTNLEFRDAIPKAEVPGLLAQADVLLACVLDADVYRFGANLNKLVDYLASRRPVIFAGRVPNDPVREADAGFAVQPESPAAMVDALERFERLAPSERCAMGERGRAYVEENYDMRKLGVRMEALLERAVQDRGT